MEQTTLTSAPSDIILGVQSQDRTTIHSGEQMDLGKKIRTLEVEVEPAAPPSKHIPVEPKPVAEPVEVK